MDAPELKSCPFCGGKAELWRAHPHPDRAAWIACMSKCSVLVSKEHKTDAEAIAAWNTRADIPAARIAELEAELEAYREMASAIDAQGGPNVIRLQMQARRDRIRADKAEAENAMLRELIFGAGVNLWDRAELSERDENGNRTILLWHSIGVPSLILGVESHAPGMDAGHIEFAMSDLLDVFMARERARAALAKDATP